MDNTDFEQRLSRALHSGVDSVQPSPGLVEAGAARGAAARRRLRLAGAAAAALVAVGAGWAAYHAPSSRPDTAANNTSCRSAVDRGVLPPWARTGFSEPDPRVAHVLGDRGRIVAILFGQTLYAPPSDQVNNKILWVTAPSNASADPGASADLVIDAVLAGTDETTQQVVAGGAGPSIIDLPAAGCWHLDLSWGTRDQDHDTLDLEYIRPPR
jgi:hypothetical protein